MGRSPKYQDEHETIFPWQMQPGETSKAFEAFKIFREMKPFDREVKKVAIALGYTKYDVCYKWAKLNKWHDRARAWDKYNDDRDLMLRKKTEDEMLKNQAKKVGQISNSLTKMSLELNKRLLKVDEKGQSFLDTLTNEELLALNLKAASVLPRLLEAERTALGVHPKINIVSKIDLTRLTDEELEAIARGD